MRKADRRNDKRGNYSPPHTLRKKNAGATCSLLCVYIQNENCSWVCGPNPVKLSFFRCHLRRHDGSDRSKNRFPNVTNHEKCTIHLHMKKAFLIITVAIFCSNCQNNFELSKEQVEYLSYSEASNWRIGVGQPILTGEYEKWKSSQYEIMKNDVTKEIKPFVVVNLGADSVRMSLLALTGFLERESHKDNYAVEWAVISDGVVRFLPSDYFDDRKPPIFLNDLSENVKKRYSYADSLNLKCPEWWIIGEAESEVIGISVFEEILAGYVDFTNNKFLGTYQSAQFEKLLQKHKKKFPLRVSIEEPICRFGVD